VSQFTGLPDEDLLYVQWHNEIAGAQPYFIAIDEPKQAIVLSIRGSLSLKDCVTDVLCEPAALDEFWMGTGAPKFSPTCGVQCSAAP
jgi:sn1-specific diacylglycerol lipase